MHIRVYKIKNNLCYSYKPKSLIRMIACGTCCKKHAIREILKLYINYI